MLLRFVIVLGFVLAAGQAAAEEKPVLKTEKDKISYSIGVDIGANLTRQGIEIDPETLARGIKDAVSGGKTLMTDDEIREVLTAFQKDLMAKAEARANQAAGKNKQSGDAFLTENKKKEGVTTLPSGLQYKIITTGNGKKPKADDTVTTHYRGTLIDGTEFDSSYKRGQPASFPVGGVIAGWTEALQLMPVGSKWQLFIPSDLAYGTRGAGPMIGPNAALIFEVELLSIEEGESKK